MMTTTMLDRDRYVVEEKDGMQKKERRRKQIEVCLRVTQGEPICLHRGMAELLADACTEYYANRVLTSASGSVETKGTSTRRMDACSSVIV